MNIVFYLKELMVLIRKKNVTTGKYLISVPSITKSFATKFLRKCTSDITFRFFLSL